MVAIASATACGSDTEAVLAKLDMQLGASTRAAFVYAFYGCDHDDRQLLAFLDQRFPDAAIIGGTSCSGVMNERGLSDVGAIGLLLVDDPAGDYGVAAGYFGADPAGAAEQLLHAALADAGCPGEVPELIWIYQAPGHEEAVMEGLRRVVGDCCPVIGGSAADDTVSGGWRQIGNDRVLHNGLVIAAMFPSGGVGYAFQGGYEPAGPSGIVTQVGFNPDGDGGIVTAARGREILSIDGAPAAEVFDAWIGHRLGDKVAGGNILVETTMCPLAVDGGRVEGVPHYILVHPDAIGSDGSIRTFAAVAEGSRIYSMRGDRRRLIARAGRVAREAVAALPGGSDQLAGGLMVYCAGCKIAVDDDMPSVARTVADSFGSTPFLGCFTFGEQGHLANRNVHGNLMISAIAFGR